MRTPEESEQITILQWARQWRPASGHRKGWRVVRDVCPMQEHEDRRGRRILFKSHDAAKKRADLLNREAAP